MRVKAAPPCDFGEARRGEAACARRIDVPVSDFAAPRSVEPVPVSDKDAVRSVEAVSSSDEGVLTSV
jgi:hypothetical protein